MQPNRDTVRLHKEFVPTACPHRSWELHGKETNAVKDYFISQIKKYMGQQTVETVSRSLENENNKKDVATMHCIYERPMRDGKPNNDNGNTWGIYYCNGVNCRHIPYEDNVKLLQDLYKKNNGQEIPRYTQKDWNINAPWYKRLEEMFSIV